MTCKYCGEERTPSGWLKHAETCPYKDAADKDITVGNERTVIFCPYIPEILKPVIKGIKNDSTT